MSKKSFFTVSIDVEDWFQVENLNGVISPSEWDQKDYRVESNTQLVLDILNAHNIKATFFILGWIAERSPDLIRTIADHGHEIASHGYGHKLLHTMDEPATKDDCPTTVIIEGNDNYN